MSVGFKAYLRIVPQGFLGTSNVLVSSFKKFKQTHFYVAPHVMLSKAAFQLDYSLNKCYLSRYNYCPVLECLPYKRNDTKGLKSSSCITLWILHNQRFKLDMILLGSSH